MGILSTPGHLLQVGEPLRVQHFAYVGEAVHRNCVTAQRSVLPFCLLYKKNVKLRKFYLFWANVSLFPCLSILCIKKKYTTIQNSNVIFAEIWSALIIGSTSFQVFNKGYKAFNKSISEGMLFV